MSVTDQPAQNGVPSLDIDPFSTEFFDDMHAAHQVLREAGPVVWLAKWGIYGVARHVVETADDGSSPLPKLPAFAAFQDGIRERCAEPPMRKGATVVGNYRMGLLGRLSRA